MRLGFMRARIHSRRNRRTRHLRLSSPAPLTPEAIIDGREKKTVYKWLSLFVIALTIDDPG
jgi:hypothetical protein